MVNDSTIQRVLITGATGSGARYLIDYIRKHHPHVEIHGMARRKNAKKTPEGVTLHEVDLLDTGSIIRCLRLASPQIIFHLAANPDKGFEIPSAILMNNAVGTVNLFEALRFYIDDLKERGEWLGSQVVVVNVSSSEVYGAVLSSDIPIKEDCPKRPVSPYAVSKLAQDCLAGVYHKAYGMNIITTRSFTYNNFYRTNLFTSDFARQIALIEIGKQQVLKHGNLDSVRVMCDARDIAHAYWLCATKCQPGEAYNIGGGQQITVRSVLLKLINMAMIPIDYREDPALKRPVDVTLQVPDCSKFREATGWQPQFDLDVSLRDLLNHWRKEVRKN